MSTLAIFALAPALLLSIILKLYGHTMFKSFAFGMLLCGLLMGLFAALVLYGTKSLPGAQTYTPEEVANPR